jgi:hypothetical protein
LAKILDIISVDGAIRVVSDEFSISLLNPGSDAYKNKAEKYSKMVRIFSHLNLVNVV